MADGDDLLGGLPKTRPSRRARRAAGGGEAPGPQAANRPKAAPRTPARKAAARPRPQSASRASAPRPKSEPRVPPAGFASAEGGAPKATPGGVVGLAVTAAGELAQLGVAVGTKASRALLGRLTGR